MTKSSLILHHHLHFSVFLTWSGCLRPGGTRYKNNRTETYKHLTLFSTESSDGGSLWRFSLLRWHQAEGHTVKCGHNTCRLGLGEVTCSANSQRKLIVGLGNEGTWWAGLHSCVIVRTVRTENIFNNTKCPLIIKVNQQASGWNQTELSDANRTKTTC